MPAVQCEKQGCRNRVRGGGPCHLHKQGGAGKGSASRATIPTVALTPPAQDERDPFVRLGIDPEVGETYLNVGMSYENAARVAFLDIKWKLRDPADAGWGDGGFITGHLDMILDSMCKTDDDLEELGMYLHRWRGRNLLDATGSLLDYARTDTGFTMSDFAAVDWYRNPELIDEEARGARLVDASAVMNLVLNSPHDDPEKYRIAAQWIDSTRDRVLESVKLRHCSPSASPDVARCASASDRGSDPFEDVLLRSEVAYRATAGLGEDECREAIRKMAAMKTVFTPLVVKKDRKARDTFGGFNEELVSLAADAYKLGRLEQFMELASSGAHRAQLESVATADNSVVLSEGAL